MSSAFMILLIAFAGTWHVLRLRTAGMRPDMWTAAALYAFAVLIAAMLASKVIVPSPLALVFRLFSGLSRLMATF